jgi:hypothetical protein
MRLLKKSQRPNPKVSIVLLDWSVRESFHLLHYLRAQSAPRDSFEVLVIEYYSRVSTAAQRYASEIDTWALLEMPEECYYHKHLMYNAGIAFSRGEICVFCDSDAMVRDTFVGAIAGEFDRDPEIVLHIDQFRNMRRDLYPFRFPSFDEVLGPGCANNVGGITRGLADSDDPLHERNYGACMCARREDLIAIGGSDEHVDYLGHICGPYDMTFRMVNHGRREMWHDSEFMYHTWHPGQAGVANYLGPHDGRHVSTTALDALATGRVQPFAANAAVAHLREHGTSNGLPMSLLIDDERARTWLLQTLQPAMASARTVLYRGFRIEPEREGYTGSLMLSDVLKVPLVEPIGGDSVESVKRSIDAALGPRIRAVSFAGSLYVLVWRALVTLRILLTRGVVKAAQLPWHVQRLMRTFVRRLRDGSLSRYARSVLIRFVRQLRNGTLPEVIWRTVRAKLARVQDRWQRFRMERRFLAGTLGSLLVNLHFIGRARRGGAELPPAVVMIDRRATMHYLRSLMAMRLLVTMDVIRVQSKDELDDWIATLSAGDWNGHVVVGRDFYMRNYGSLSRLRAQQRLVVA